MCLAEDGGSIELDLPRLEHYEIISKYGFTDLGLVETRKSKTLPDYSIKVTLPDGTFTVVQVTSNLLFKSVIPRSGSHPIIIF